MNNIVKFGYFVTWTTKAGQSRGDVFLPVTKAGGMGFAHMCENPKASAEDFASNTVAWAQGVKVYAFDVDGMTDTKLINLLTYVDRYNHKYLPEMEAYKFNPMHFYEWLRWQK